MPLGKLGPWCGEASLRHRISLWHQLGNRFLATAGHDLSWLQGLVSRHNHFQSHIFESPIHILGWRLSRLTVQCKTQVHILANPFPNCWHVIPHHGKSLQVEAAHNKTPLGTIRRACTTLASLWHGRHGSGFFESPPPWLATAACRSNIKWEQLMQHHGRYIHNLDSCKQGSLIYKMYDENSRWLLIYWIQ